MLNKYASFVSNPKGSKIVLLIWIIGIITLSMVAPSASDVEQESMDDGSMFTERPAANAQDVLDEHFPSEDGLVALLVYHDENKITEEQRNQIAEMSKWLESDDKPKHVASTLPFHDLPEKVQNQLFSDDETTMQINIALHKDLESGEIYDTIEEINEYADEIDENNLELKITGPAGISADTLSLFKNANLVLLFSTIGLILVLLIIIYRSPLLAVIPLIVAGMVYAVTDRIIGIGGDKGWFIVDSQATSIMTILLFAILTDYSLFILSRYRSELKIHESKNKAMANAFTPIFKPILFSGATLMIAMLILFLSEFAPYHHFAPIFTIAILFIFLGGISLIPAIFTLVGRKAFWPAIPKLDQEDFDREAKKGFWSKIGKLVTKNPGIVASILLIALLGASINLGAIKISFNQLDSFPDDIPSRQGFELLAENFPQGQLAPVNLVLTSEKDIDIDEQFVENINNLKDEMEQTDGIKEITPELEEDMIDGGKDLPRNFLADTEKSVKLQLTLDQNPYDQASLDVIDELRENQNVYLENNSFSSSDYSIAYEGQTAEQLDVRDMNQRDMVLVFTIITVLITIMLIFQSGSIITGFIMILTMLLSYTATMGLGWFVSHTILGYDAINYRIPFYVFVFLISLGVDYNIILVSRIREEYEQFKWKESIARGVSLTGGVISSAGIILAGTFTVLMTQPVQELFLFGLFMGMGVLIDTFLVRGGLLPSILTLIKPKQVKKRKKQSP